jgi:hypothetical protein
LGGDERADDFFADPAVSHFRIEIGPADMQKLRQDNRSYVHADLTAGEAKLSGVGVRLKGFGSFRPLDDKPSFAVKFDQFNPDQKFRGLTKLMLNNSTQDTTLLSEHLAVGLFRDAGVPAARVSHARVSLNGRDLGLYVAVEAMNKGFLRQHFTDPAGNMYEAYAKDVDQRLDQDNGQPGDQSDLRALLEAARAPVEARLSALRRVLDVDRFASFLAVTTVIAQHDSYPLNRNNYRLYRDPASDRFVMLPHGCDGTFSRLSLPILPPQKYVLTRALLEIPEGRKLYLERLKVLFTGNVPPVGREPGAAVRVSGGRAARRIVSAEGWTPLDCSFTVREGEEDVQFVCELRGSEGEAWFEIDSLLLSRDGDGER